MTQAGTVATASCSGRTRRGEQQTCFRPSLGALLRTAIGFYRSACSPVMVAVAGCRLRQFTAFAKSITAALPGKLENQSLCDGHHISMPVSAHNSVGVAKMEGLDAYAVRYLSYRLVRQRRPDLRTRSRLNPGCMGSHSGVSMCRRRKREATRFGHRPRPSRCAWEGHGRRDHTRRWTSSFPFHAFSPRRLRRPRLRRKGRGSPSVRWCSD